MHTKCIHTKLIGSLIFVQLCAFFNLFCTWAFAIYGEVLLNMFIVNCIIIIPYEQPGRNSLN